MAPQQVQDGPRAELLDGLPVQRHHLDAGGTATCVLEGGQGPPLLLLHGGIQAGGVVWWRVIRDLARRHRLVIPDLPGLGESAPLPRLDAASVAAWLAALVQQRCTEPPTLVAHSAPGGLAARFAAGHSGLLGRLVLVDAAGLGSFRPSPRFVVALLRSTMRPSPSNMERFLHRVCADVPRTRIDSGERWEAFLTEIATRAALPEVKQAMRQLVRAGTATLAEADLARISVPTALVWGRHDPLIDLRIGQAAAAKRGWPLRVVDDAGHLPHLEQPDRFVEALTSVVDEA